MDDKPRSLAEVVRVAIRASLADVHTAIPARVVKYDVTRQMVSVQPVIKVAHITEDDKRAVESLPQIVNVPVQFPSGGGYRITFPMKEGDTGLVLFSEASLDIWLSKGGDVDPADDRRFSLADAVFVPGVRDFAHALKSAADDRMTMGKDDGLQIHIDGSKIKIGSNVDLELDKPVLDEALNNYISALRTWLSAHVHTSAVPGSPTTPPTILPVPSPSNLGAPNVLIKKT